MKINNLIKSLGNHCPNVCVMRQGLPVPDDWIKMTNDRTKSGKPLCDECINDLFILEKKILIVLYSLLKVNA